MCSGLYFLTNTPHASITDISNALNLSHQLTSQRIKTLLSLELIEGVKDAKDRRKTLYHLTPKGQSKAQILELYCVDAAHAFKDLSNEIGVDIQQVLNQAMNALQRKSFGERFPRRELTYSQQIATYQSKENE